MRATTQTEKKAMNYLNELRDSGITNMYGACPFIENAFGLDRGESKRILILWMNNFNLDGIYDTVKE